MHALTANHGDDPVAELLLSGAAETVSQAEEMYLNAAIPEVLELLRSRLSNDELSRHPLVNLMLAHGSRGWEDSIL